jgi:hypothetical protein
MRYAYCALHWLAVCKLLLVFQYPIHRCLRSHVFALLLRSTRGDNYPDTGGYRADALRRNALRLLRPAGYVQRIL